MAELSLKLRNFMAVKEAELESKNSIVFLVAPNRAGKTQILLLIYSILWSLWRAGKEGKDIDKFIRKKIKDTLLLKKISDAVAWNRDKSSVEFSFKGLNIDFEISNRGLKLAKKAQVVESPVLFKSPIYVQPAGLGDYYKGIFSLKKYYPSWKLISEATTDLITDLLVVSDSEINGIKELEPLVDEFEELFKAKFFIQSERIFVQEKGKRYGIERTASGLKSLSWLYLIVKYGLLGEFLILDEPEVNLHPEYIDRLCKFIVEASKDRKVLISTHSDYLLESMNKYILKRRISVDVWTGYLTDEGAVFESRVATPDNLIDTTPLNATYSEILKGLFEYDGEI